MAPLGQGPGTRWDEFFSRPADSEVCNEYMVPYAAIAPFLEPVLVDMEPKEARVLIVGCGLSTLGEHVDDRFAGEAEEIMSVDISPPCIERLRARCAHRPGMRFAVEDLCSGRPTGLPAGRYRLAVDKGVLDDVLAAERPAVPSPCGEESAEADAGERAACGLLWEVRRVLQARGGVYAVVSVHGPERMAPLLQSDVLGFEPFEHFRLGSHEVGHHLYRCRLERADAPDGTLEDLVQEVLRRKYTAAMPLLTARREVELWEAFGPKARGLPAREVYELTFTALERSEYAFPEFCEDLGAFLTEAPACPASATGPDRVVSCEDLLKFLRAAQ